MTLGLSDILSAAYRERVLPLHSAWLDLFILRMMSFCEDSEAKPVWFVLDEWASLNKLPNFCQRPFNYVRWQKSECLKMLWRRGHLEVAEGASADGEFLPCSGSYSCFTIHCLNTAAGSVPRAPFCLTYTKSFSTTFRLHVS